MARLSLTKKQLDTRAGVELLGILEDVTEDGIISNEEVAHLRSKCLGVKTFQLRLERLRAPSSNAVLRLQVESPAPSAMLADGAMRMGDPSKCKVKGLDPWLSRRFYATLPVVPKVPTIA